MTTIQLRRGQTEVLSDWQLGIDADMVLRGQGANPSKVRLLQPRIVALAERAIAEGKSWIRPLVGYRILDIQEVKPARVILANGAELKGFGIVRKLAGAESVIAAVATLGAELEQQILRATKEEAAFALSLDGFGIAAMGALTTAARRFFAQIAVREHLTTTAPLHPGMRGWALAAAQTQLFSLVDAQAIGVSLNSSFLMTPCKSMSMVIGVGTKVRCAGEPCDECDASITCRHRPSNT